MESIGIWLVVLGVGTLGVVVAIWILWKLLGAVVNIARSGQHKKVRESALGRAVNRVRRDGGYNDGSPRASAEADATFLALAKGSPFVVNASRSELMAIATRFGETSGSRWPMLIDAAHGVSLLINETELAGWCKSNIDTVLSLATNFNALFPTWMRGHQVGSLGKVSIGTARMEIMMILLSDMCKISEFPHPA